MRDRLPCSGAVRPGAKFASARLLASLLALLLAAGPVLAQRTVLKPGTNLFSVEQDAQIGAQNARQAEQQLPIVSDPQISNYLNRLGQRLAEAAPGPRFRYTFKLVNDKSINAFALPGGYVYVNRGVVEMADNEAQLAGVMGHEIGHVALRHGTNQATKAQYTQGLLGILGVFVGATGSTAAQLAAQLGAGFTAQSILLKYSRDAERQADLVGAQVLYDSGYDPRALPQFFEKLAAQDQSGRSIEFFASHPNPDHRAENVSVEIRKLGGLPANARTDSADFREFKRLVAQLPAASRRGSRLPAATGRPPSRPSNRMEPYDGRFLSMSYPQNWEAVAGSNDELGGITFAPPGGVVADSSGRPALAYGMLVGVYPGQGAYRNLSLEDATEQFLERMKGNNPHMELDSQRIRVRVGGRPALSTYFENESPARGTERGWVATVRHSQGLVYFVGVSQERQFETYDDVFHMMLESVRFRPQ